MPRSASRRISGEGRSAVSPQAGWPLKYVHQRLHVAGGDDHRQTARVGNKGPFAILAAGRQKALRITAEVYRPYLDQIGVGILGELFQRGCDIAGLERQRIRCQPRLDDFLALLVERVASPADKEQDDDCYNPPRSIHVGEDLADKTFVILVGHCVAPMVFAACHP